MKAPTIPMMRSPTIPNPVPCTIWPASHPAMTPTPNMIRRLSFDMCIFVSSSAIFALGDLSLEVPIIERVILDLDRDPLVMGIERRAAGHSPRFKDTIELKSKIVMQPRCRMLLDNEPPPIGGGDPRLATWLGGLGEISLRAVF